MIKRTLIIFAVFFLGQSAFAVDAKALNLEFFNRFNDNHLYEYVNDAFAYNHNLAKTSLKVDEYREQIKYSLGAELPHLSVGANYLGLHFPDIDNVKLSQNAFVLPFIASYEPDFLLKNRDKTRSAKKAYEASQNEEKAVYMSLLTDVATVYVNLLQYDDLINSQREIVSTSAQILAADKRKYERGIINSTKLNNSQKDWIEVKNTLVKLQKEQKVLQMQLAVLCAYSPEDVDKLARGKFSTFEYKGKALDSFPVDIVSSRPDIAMAELKLEKAKIDARVAKKELFPKFNITGVWAFNTIAQGSFFSWESSLAFLLAGATQDLFKGGMKLANLRIHKLRYVQLIEEYKQTNLDAIKEVNTALCIMKHDTNLDKNTKAQLELEEKNYQNMQRKLTRGTIANPEYLESKKRLLVMEQNKTKMKAQRLVDYLTLYKAVGGNL